MVTSSVTAPGERNLSDATGSVVATPALHTRPKCRAFFSRSIAANRFLKTKLHHTVDVSARTCIMHRLWNIEQLGMTSSQREIISPVCS